MKRGKHTKEERRSFGEVQKRMTERTFKDKSKFNRKKKHKKEEK